MPGNLSIPFQAHLSLASDWLRAGSCFLASLTALACAGCGAPLMVGTHIGGELTSSDTGYPVRNPRTSRTIEISGEVSTMLQLKLTAHYLTNGTAGCNSSPSFIAGSVEGVKFPSSVGIPVAVKRSYVTYSATIVLDEFIPGRCDWQFGYLTADLSKAGLISLPNLIVRARDGWRTPFVETKSENSSDTPVVLHCDFRRLASDSANVKSNACLTAGDMTHKYKREHFYSAATKQVVANFIDDDATN